MRRLVDTDHGTENVAPTIRAAIFDWGGVIQRTEDYGPRQQLDEELGLPPGGIERAVFDSVFWREASLGACSAAEAWSAIAESVGYPPDRLAQLVERFFAGDRIDDVLLRWIRALGAQGLRTGLLSNAPGESPPGVSALSRWGMEGLFDAQVFSYQVGALKPDPRMYQAILDALGVSPSEALFVDDSAENVQGALQAGMDAILFVARDVLWREFARRGLPILLQES
ncbi:MAG: hypothetical protein A2Y73_05940 [Chloroflexi bacterium RBG_13_56_8]|nr:MAG: hypothetical protein A2Y73_05940 [Chloroflexi bacterium RBG_13_56_8]